jgi:hypothetical protein
LKRCVVKRRMNQILVVPAISHLLARQESLAAFAAIARRPRPSER